MSFRQVYYTSCETGLRGGKGFQVNAATEDVSPAVLQQVERLGLYVPPVSAPSRPTPEEVEGFPVSLLFQHVGGGTAVLAQAKYVGRDYSGRYGNFFTHSLVTDAPEFDIAGQGLLPVALWRSEDWVGAESATTSLAPLERPSKGETVSPLLVEEFLREAGRLERLPAFLTAVEGALATGRRVVIVDDTDSVALWIAAAAYVLPSHLGLKLTFNTYVKNPYQTDFLIVGTTADSDFAFASHEVEHQYYVFDFHGGRFTPVPEPSPFALKVAAAYGEGWEPSGFRRFADFMAPGLPLEELDTAFASYAQTAGLTLPGVDPAAVVRWCAARIASFSPEQMELLCELMWCEQPPRRELVAACGELYSAVQREPVHPSVAAMVETQYLAWLLRNVSDSAPDGLLEEAAAHLTAPTAPRLDVEELRPYWHEQLRAKRGARRLCAQLLIGDKLGFLDRGGESLRRAGEESVGPALADPAVQAALARLADSPAARDVIKGAGAYLRSRPDKYEAVMRLSRLTAEPWFFGPLEEFAFAEHAHWFYFCMVAGRAAVLLPGHPGARVDAFEHSLNVAGRLGHKPSDRYADAVFAVLWPNETPTTDEALGLLAVLRRGRLAAPEVCRRAAELVVFPGDQPPGYGQRELVEQLSSKPFYEVLGEYAVMLDAYQLAFSLKHAREGSAETVGEALSFLKLRAASLEEPVREKLSGMAAARLAYVKDASTHCVLLSRACREGDPATWLANYGEELKTSLTRRAAGQSRAVARLFEIWLATEQVTGEEPANTLLTTVLPQALKDWKERELEEVDCGLRDNLPALRRWISWREEFVQTRGLTGRIKQWFNQGRRGTAAGGNGHE
jgi:hypothetical protein